MNVYEEINTFLACERTADELVEFSATLIAKSPLNKKLVQEWCLGMFVTERFSKGVYKDTVLVSYDRVFCLDSASLEGRKIFRGTT